MRRRISFQVVLISIFTLILAGVGCNPSRISTAEVEPIPLLTITSSAFSEGQTIPVKYTCDGEDISPPLEWSGIPSNAKSLVLIADDPDAPIGNWVHWVIFDIPTSLTGFTEGVASSELIEGVGVQGKNGSQNIGYNGPCPPKGKPHRYYFKLYALDASLDLSPGIEKKELEEAMKGHILAQGQLYGIYGR